MLCTEWGAETCFSQWVLESIFFVLITFHIIVKKQVMIFHSAIEACKITKAVVIATEWKEFLKIKWEEVYMGMNKPAFVFVGKIQGAL